MPRLCQGVSLVGYLGKICPEKSMPEVMNTNLVAGSVRRLPLLRFVHKRCTLQAVLRVTLKVGGLKMNFVAVAAGLCK